MLDHWDPSGRDVLPDLAAGGKPLDVGAAMLHGLLTSEGATWAPPYEEVRKSLSIRKKAILPELEDQKDSRIRTYEVLFRGLGLLHAEDGVLHATELGKAVLAHQNEQYKAVDDFGRALALNAEDRLARLVAPALARYQLASPISPDTYPPGTDIRPLLAMWRVMRAINNKLHWEELGRALTPCLREEDLPAVIERISQARTQSGYDPSDEVGMEIWLGPRKPNKGADQSDRLDTWFSRAAFKGLLLEPRDRADGYRHLRARFVPLLDEILDNPPPYNDTDSAANYVEWLGQAPTSPPPTAMASTLEGVVRKAVARCRKHGSRQVITLVGPAGTGKTTAAERAALILADGDESRVLTVQFHAGFTYEEFVGGLAPTASGHFEPTAGALLQINELAERTPDKTHVLVIDELSRADVANVLGELLTYIEYRGRPFRVPALGREVAIAPNLIVLATMNPADRSVVNMDDALVRRLRQLPVPRDQTALGEILSSSGMPGALAASVVDWFTALPSDTPFGHGVFVGVRDEQDLQELWEEELQFFLRRGGLTIYPEPERIEHGYVWRHLPQAHVPAAEQVADVQDVTVPSGSEASVSDDSETIPNTELPHRAAEDDDGS